MLTAWLHSFSGVPSLLAYWVQLHAAGGPWGWG